MAATFPLAPVNGQIYDWQGISYQYDATDDTWRRVHASYYVAEHNHDGRYYTEIEMDNILAFRDSNLASSLATKVDWTHDITLSLAGDASGSATFTNMGNATLTVVVANDSHTHDTRYYTETESNARFLGITAKAADANLLDGLNSTQFLRSDTSDTMTGNLSVQGTIYATGDVFAYYSDARLKDNITGIPNALDKIKTLNGVTFTWNETAQALHLDGTTNNVGLLAQEVQAVLPEAVAVMPSSLGDGNSYLTVKYERLVPLLLESIKEQQLMIDAMQKRIAKLEE